MDVRQLGNQHVTPTGGLKHSEVFPSLASKSDVLNTNERIFAVLNLKIAPKKYLINNPHASTFFYDYIYSHNQRQNQLIRSLKQSKGISKMAALLEVRIYRYTYTLKFFFNSKLKQYVTQHDRNPASTGKSLVAFRNGTM